MNNKKKWWSVGFVVFGGVAVFVLVFARGVQKADARLDGFVQCLADKQITMYGADWCPHCQNEKNAFGDSFRLVQYVECPREPRRCLAAGVTRYPTWTFPDGRTLEGEQGLENLSRESGCALPQ
jgi:hypothetical protein